MPNGIPKSNPDLYEELTTVKGCAKVFGVSEQTVYNWLRSGDLQGYRLPGAGSRSPIYTTRAAIRERAITLYKVKES